MGQYPNLPGYTTTLAEGSLKFVPNAPNTDSVLLIGYAHKGPLLEVQKPKSLAEAIETFGPTVDNVLVKGFAQVVDAGCEDVSLMAINAGTAAFAEVEDTEVTPNKIFTITAVRKGMALDGTVVDFEDGTFSITGGMFDTAITFPIGADDDIDELVSVLETQHPGMFEIDIEEGEETTLISALNLPVTLSGGSSGGTSSTELNNAYDLLLHTQVDFVVPLGATEDEAQGLAEFCAKASGNNKLVQGVIATRTKGNEETIDDYATAMEAIDTEYVDGDNNDVGKFISVVVGEGQFSLHGVGLYHDTMAAVYAGFVSTLPPQSAPTNKVLPGVRSIPYIFSASQLNDLTGNKLVTFRRKPGRGVVTTDGMTASSEELYARLTTMRITATVVQAIRDVCDPFIGEAGGLVQRNSMNTAISSGMKALKDAGLLQAYTFIIKATPQEMTQGIYNVDIEIVPVFEIRKVRATITLRPEL